METTDLTLLPTLDALLQEGSVTGRRATTGASRSRPISHALARLRARFDDPLLVRAGSRDGAYSARRGLRAQAPGRRHRAAARVF
jgi:DNA-binding transcriptional LysR family regulator